MHLLVKIVETEHSNAWKKQYKIHLSHLLFKLSIQLLMNVLYLPKYKMTTIYNIQLSGKYLH